MKTPDFRPAIRRALQRECKSNLLGLIAPASVSSSRARLGNLRCDAILSMLWRGDVVRSGALAAAMQTPLSVILRDIEYLANQGHQIAYEPKRDTYVLSHTHNS